MLSKAEARNFGRLARAAMTVAERAEADRRIVERCQRDLNWPRFLRIHMFLPIERHKELSTWPLLSWLLSNRPHVSVYVPRMKGNELEHVRVTSETAYRTNKHGIPEPVAGEMLGGLGGDDGMLDLVLVPLLAFDAWGNRVGYGGGYYDRFLASQPTALKVGLGYDASFIRERIEAEPHDIPLDAIVTEGCLRNFKSV